MSGLLCLDFEKDSGMPLAPTQSFGDEGQD
jgi:hypothetical protein